MNDNKNNWIYQEIDKKSLKHHGQEFRKVL